MNNFEKLYESVSTTLIHTKVLRYPKQILLSDDFKKALRKEMMQHMSILDESSQPIRDLPEKFLKALQFELTAITEACNKRKTMNTGRKEWSIKPVQKVHTQGKKTGYDRAREKAKFEKERS